MSAARETCCVVSSDYGRFRCGCSQAAAFRSGKCGDSAIRRRDSRRAARLQTIACFKRTPYSAFGGLLGKRFQYLYFLHRYVVSVRI